MVDERQVQQLLDEVLDSERTPEEVCAASPELLPEVSRRWRQIRLVEAEIEALFPKSGPTTDAVVPQPPGKGMNLPCIPGYELIAVLGRGGMGVVFQARHLKLNRLVALKMLLAGAYAGPHELERFRREAEAVAALRHPHIVQIYDVGDLDGQPYFTMEFEEGGSLAQQLSRTRPPIRQAAELVATLAGAVQFAHKSGIIHRDLKPGNILLTADGTPKITDFGLARSVNEGPALTLSGARLGTPSYMAPEQALGKTSAIGPSVDVYALGAVLYETLTGRPPFEGATAGEIERQIIAEEPKPPSRLNASVPRDLDTICLKCLHKNPARRYASAQDLADDLHRYLDGHPVLARPVGVLERMAKWARRRPTLATLLLTLLIVLGAAVGTGFWLQQQRSSRQAVARQTIEDGIPRAYELGRAEKWQDAKQVLADVQGHLSFADSDELSTRIARAQADLQFAEQLEHIRQSHASSLIEQISYTPTPNQVLLKDYAQAFADAKFDIDAEDSTAAKIRASEVRVQIVAALDLWAFAAYREHRETLRTQLLRIAQSADRDPVWRDRFRDPTVWSDRQKLVQLAGDAVNAKPPLAAHQLAITGLLLADADKTADSVRLLREALDRRQGDFWLYWEMGVVLQNDKKDQDAATYFRIVAALRPENPWILNRLGGALSNAGQVKEAIAIARRAVELEPKNALLRYNLAVDLFRDKQFDKAQTECRLILESDPNNALALYVLGHTLDRTNRPEEAIATYRRVTEIDPEHQGAWYQLGAGLVNAGRLDEGAEVIDRTVQRFPGFFLAHVARGHIAMRQQKYTVAVKEYKSVILVLDRAKSFIRELSDQDSEHMYADAWQELAEALCCLGRFAEARDAAQRAIDLPRMAEANGASMSRRLERCKQLVAVESRLPAILAELELPSDVATQRALAEWLYKDKHLNYASAQLYGAVFAKQPSLADDLVMQNRIDAGCAAALAGSGLGADAASLDDAKKTELRKQALAWFKAERDAWATRQSKGTITEQLSVAAAVRALQSNGDLACLRDQAALAKLPTTEAREWQSLWADVNKVAVRDPLMLKQAREYASRKEWAKAAEIYTLLSNESPTSDSEVWFEYAAVQLLMEDRPGYRQTCKRMLEGAPKIRAYLVARACTLAPDSVDDAALPARLSAKELEQFTATFWSLTEQGALSYRANRYKEAIPLLQRSLEVETKPGAAVVNWLWLAMAYQKMGKTDEARRWLNRAETWLDSFGNTMPSSANAPGLHLHNWLEAQVLRREAKELFAEPAEK